MTVELFELEAVEISQSQREVYRAYCSARDGEQLEAPLALARVKKQNRWPAFGKSLVGICLLIFVICLVTENLSDFFFFAACGAFGSFMTSISLWLFDRRKESALLSTSRTEAEQKVINDPINTYIHQIMSVAIALNKRIARWNLLLTDGIASGVIKKGESVFAEFATLQGAIEDVEQCLRAADFFRKWKNQGFDTETAGMDELLSGLRGSHARLGALLEVSIDDKIFDTDALPVPPRLTRELALKDQEQEIDKRRAGAARQAQVVR